MAEIHLPPPPGWRVFHGELTRDESVLGYLRRKQGMRGGCYTRDCRRSYNLDFELLLRRGFAYVPMKELQRLLRCNMPGGCPLSFQEDRAGSGLPLSTLRDYPLARLRLRCGACRWEKITSPAQAIRGLEKAGTGGPATLHTDLIKTFTRPCAKCGKAAWTCEVLWPGPTSPATHGEKRAAELRRQGRYGVRD